MSSNDITALQSVATTRKPSRVRRFKEDYAQENTILKMDNHALTCMNEKLLQSNTRLIDQINNQTITHAIRLLVKAVARKVRGV